MEAMTINGGSATVSADHGDVESSVLGIGYEPEELERVEEDEDLAAAEESLGASSDDDAPLGELPGEGAVAAEPPAEPVPPPAYNADSGDVPGTAIGAGYDPSTLAHAEDLEDLSEAEAASLVLPGEQAATVQTAPIDRPTGLSGWFKREPLVAALLLANAPILGTLVTSITQDNQTLSILAGSATLVLNAAVAAARKAVTPTAYPKLTEVTPLVPSGSV